MRHLLGPAAAGHPGHLVFCRGHQRAAGGVADGGHTGAGHLADLALELVDSLPAVPVAGVLGGGCQSPAHPLHPAIEPLPRHLAAAFAARARTDLRQVHPPVHRRLDGHGPDRQAHGRGQSADLCANRGPVDHDRIAQQLLR
ncbi:hypothetical protein D3C85_1448920 [compost metagenome]